jgi:zinc transport system permease protein
MQWYDDAIAALAHLFPDGSFYSYGFNVEATLGILLTCLVCGGIGVIVVGNRMAFFSDALAHCAFAGVSLGLILGALSDLPDASVESFVTLIMVVFGVLIGVGIAFVRERTGLASDTVIGVFFAFAVGIGAVLTNVFSRRFRFFNIESFSFGSPLAPAPTDVVLLAILLVVVAAFLLFFYNDLVLASVHPSLALSRGVRVRLLRYLLVILMGIIVNLCLRIVGVLLINGLLIVPAAAASNLSRNLRQTFWWTLGLTIAAGLGGQWGAWEINRAASSSVGLGGAIVVLCCIFFFASMILRPILRGSGRTA